MARHRRASSLDVLFPSTGSERFIREYWLNNRHLLEAGEARRFRGVLHLPAFANIDAFIAQHEKHIMATVHTSYASRSLLELRKNHAVDLYRCGATLTFDDFDASARAPHWRSFVDNLARELGLLPRFVRCAAFGARGPGPGSQLHCDNKDIFVVQIVGSKRWSFGPNRELLHPVHNISADLAKHISPRGFRTADLLPGSVLFLPRDWWHQTEVLSDEALSLTIGFERPARIHMLTTALHNHLRRDPQWRSPAGGAWASKQGRDAELRVLTSMLEKLRQELAHLRPEDLLGDRLLAEDATRYVVATRTSCTLRSGPNRRQWILRVGGAKPKQFAIETRAVRDLVRWCLAQRKDFSAAEAGRAAPSIGLQQVVGLLTHLSEAGAIHTLPSLCQPRSL